LDIFGVLADTSKESDLEVDDGTDAEGLVCVYVCVIPLSVVHQVKGLVDL